MTDDEFWAAVDRSGGPAACWPYTKGLHGHGYGITYTEDGTQVLAHRRALILTDGPPPDGKPHALHSCDNPPCSNPRHLRWGTHPENMADKVARGRAKPGRKDVPYCPHGHEMTEGNTLHRSKKNLKTGAVYATKACRECNRQYLARRRANRKQVTA